MGRKHGYGSYKGHLYKMLGKGRRTNADGSFGPSLYAIADETGERRSEWHWSMNDAVSDFKAGVDDILTNDETSHD